MNTKTTLVLALVAAVAAGYVVLVEKPWREQTAETEVKSAAVALFEPKFDDPDRVEVQRRADGKKLVFVQDATDKSWKMLVFVQDAKDKSWKRLSSLEMPAVEYQVKSIIDNVGGLKYTRKYGPGDKDLAKVAGLENPVASVRLLKGDKEVASVVVGSRLPTGKGNFLKINGQLKVKAEGKDETVTDKDIMEAHSDGKTGTTIPDFTEPLTAKTDTFRDKNVLKFDVNDVKRVKVEGDRNFVLVKNGENWVLESPARSRADKSKAQSVPQALCALSVAAFKDDAPVSVKPFGLEPARMKVTVETEKKIPPKAQRGDPNTKPADIEPTVKPDTYVLEIGGPADATAKQYFARLGGKPWVFAINDYTYKALGVDVSDLQDKKIATIETAKVKTIKAETPAGVVTFTKQDKLWVDGDNKPANSVAVEDLLKSVNNLQAVNYVDPKTELMIKMDWDKPRARIAITEEGSLTPVTVLVGPVSTSGKMVFVRNAAEQAVAAVTDDAVAQLLEGPVSYRDRSVMKFDKARAKKIEIARTGGDPITLTQKLNEWSMAEPVAAPVDREAVRNLVQSVSNLSAKRIVGSGDKTKYGLDAPAVKLAVYVEPLTIIPNAKVVGATQPASAPDAKPAATTKPASTRPAKTTAEKIKDIETLLEYQKTNAKENPKATEMLRQELAKLKAGSQPAGAATKPAVADKPAEPAAPQMTVLRLSLAQKDGKTYGAVDGNDLVYEIENQVFTDASAELHDRQVTKYESNKVTEVEFTAGPTTLTLRKTGEDWKYVADPVLPIDKEKVTKALDDLKDVKTHRFVSYGTSDLAKYGLEAPARKAMFVLDGGQRVQVLISAKGPQDDPDKAVYAAVAGQKPVFLLKPDQAAKFGRNLDEFEKRATPGST